MAVKTVQYVLNGTTYNLTYNSSTGKYEATITAPSKSSYSQSNHYYNGTVTAQDTAGNIASVTQATIPALQLIVKEKTAPVIAITAPTSGQLLANNKPSIIFEVTDLDSGVNSASVTLQIDSLAAVSESAMTKNSITNGYRYSYTPSAALGDGAHTIKVNAKDNDGNEAAVKTQTFTVDTTPPTLSITEPISNLVTNNPTCQLSGKTNDATSSPCTVAVKLNSGSAQTITVSSDGSFGKTLTLSEGINTITVVSKDGAGKETTVTRNVTLDTTPPKIGTVTLTPNPVDAGATFVIAVEVTD